jgi:hypothetical protein
MDSANEKERVASIGGRHAFYFWQNANKKITSNGSDTEQQGASDDSRQGQ